MRFSWDPYKSAANFERRDFGFDFACLIFDADTVEWVDRRREYGEKRVVAIGLVKGVPITVVYTDRIEDGEAVRRIISARVSNHHERQAYSQEFG